MNGRVAKKLRRENSVVKPKKFFKPYMVPVPRKIPGTDETETVDTYMPRKIRRKLMRQFKTYVKKGRIDLNKLAKT